MANLPDAETEHFFDFDIIVEWDLLNDAVRELRGVLDRVRFRHGGRFRKLEALIDDYLQARDDTSPLWPELQPGWFVATVPFRLSEVLAEARRLKV